MGTGTHGREFLYADDCADVLVHLMKHYSGYEHVNVGSGMDVTIWELLELVCRVVGFEGRIVQDTSKLDGTARKLMSADKLRASGWQPRIGLEEGVRATYGWFLENKAQG